MAKATTPPAIGSTLSQVEEKLTVLLYGEPGTSKTTSALRLSKLGPIVVINAEGGAKPTPLRQQGVVLENVQVWPGDDKGADHISYETIMEEVYEPMRLALEQDPNAYVGLVVDSFTELSRRILEKVAAAAAEKARLQGKPRDTFQIDLADHGTNSQTMRTLLRRFRDLNIHLVITALERRDIDQQTAEVKYGPAMGPAIANDTMGLVDVVAWCTVEQLGEHDETFYIGTVRPKNRRQAKDRFGVLPIRMINPTADRMIGYINGELDKGGDPLQLAAKAAMGIGVAPGVAPEAAAAPVQAEAAADAEAAAEGPPWVVEEATAETSEAAGAEPEAAAVA